MVAQPVAALGATTEVASRAAIEPHVASDYVCTMLITLLVAALIGQSTVTVPVGAMGVAAVKNSTTTRVTLTLVFPSIAPRAAGRVTAMGALTLFDGQGKLATLSAPDGRAVMWCENDGGDQYRPEFVVELSIAELPRKLVPTEKDENGQPIVAFVVVTGGTPLSPLVHGPTKPVLSGDLNADGKPEGAIVRRPADAGCGPRYEWDRLVLVSAVGSFDLRCCGP